MSLTFIEFINNYLHITLCEFGKWIETYNHIIFLSIIEFKKILYVVNSFYKLNLSTLI